VETCSKAFFGFVQGMGKVHAFQMLAFCHWLVLLTHCCFCLALMKPISWFVHSDMENTLKPVQMF